MVFSVWVVAEVECNTVVRATVASTVVPCVTLVNTAAAVAGQSPLAQKRSL